MRIATDLMAWDNTAMTADRVSASIPLDHLYAVSLQVSFTGSPTGTLSLQCSDDDVTYCTIDNSDQAITAAGTHIWDVTQISTKYIRAAYTFTSGSGTLSDVRFYAKGG